MTRPGHYEGVENVYEAALEALDKGRYVCIFPVQAAGRRTAVARWYAFDDLGDLLEDRDPRRIGAVHAACVQIARGQTRAEGIATPVVIP